MNSETQRFILETFFMNGETKRFVCAPHLPYTLDSLPGGRL